MINYIKCKYDLKLSDEILEKLSVDLDTVTFICDSILNKHGDFLVRSNGELCHNLVEYQEVSDEELGKPDVIWNGTSYARVINTKWDRVNYTGELVIKTQLIAKKTDADIKIKFEFENGYVTNCEPNVLLIDNTQRLNHTEKIKNIAIKRAKYMNSFQYKILKNLILNPLINICIYLRYPLIICQESLVNIENKLRKKL